MRFVQDVLTLYIIIIVVSSLLSWFPASSTTDGLAATKRVLHHLTEPILRPLRSIIPGTSIGIDFSPFVAILILAVIKSYI
jgi:YggT family protein